MIYRCFIFLCVAAFLLSSCDDNTSQRLNSTGNGSEIIVVCNKTTWDGPIGDSLRSLFTSNLQGLPEPEFSLVNVPEENFSKTLHTHHNVLMVNITPEYKKSFVATLNDEWAQPQQIFQIKANSDSAFFRVFAPEANHILEMFRQNERICFNAQNELQQNTDVEKILSDEFGITMIVSKDFRNVKKTKDCIWLQSDIDGGKIGLMIYSEPFKDTAQLNPSHLLKLRNSHASNWYSGSSDSTGMVTFYKNNLPITKKILFKEMLTLESRGFWKTNDTIIEGSFINYSIVDAPHHRIIGFDGNVNIPGKPNRNYIRQLESIIWTAELGAPAN